MQIETNGTSLTLRRGQVLRLGNGDGHTVCASEGTLWVTEEGSRKDIVIEAGGCHALHGKTLIQGLGPVTTLSLA